MWRILKRNRNYETASLIMPLKTFPSFEKAGPVVAKRMKDWDLWERDYSYRLMFGKDNKLQDMHVNCYISYCTAVFAGSHKHWSSGENQIWCRESEWRHQSSEVCSLWRTEKSAHIITLTWWIEKAHIIIFNMKYKVSVIRCLMYLCSESLMRQIKHRHLNIIEFRRWVCVSDI